VILIGQYDSPFVRRVGIALRLYDLPFEHWPWSTFGDAQRLAEVNPLRRVPTLVLDDGAVLIESGTILDHLDELVGAKAALIADSGQARREALKVCALATGVADKSVSLFYERILRDEHSKLWMDRCNAQVAGAFDVLDKDRAARGTPFWFGDSIGHADIAVACVIRFTREAHPAIFTEERWPALAAHAARCEDLPPFREIVQPLIPPK
jgi:glutathione S-transferase